VLERDPGPRSPTAEVWWARLDGRTPVVLLPGGRAIRVVPPATPEQRRGFVVLSGEEAADDRERQRIIAAAGPDVGAVGAEVAIGTAEGLPFEGVVRVAFPRDGRIFCTWETTLTPDDLIERAGRLSAGKQRQLVIVLRLAGWQPTGL
jgi:mRNA interferase MazF